MLIWRQRSGHFQTNSPIRETQMFNNRLLNVFAIVTLAVVAALTAWMVMVTSETASRGIADRSYDAVEQLRVGRLANPAVADHAYDTIEQLRSERLVGRAVADHSYDTIEDARAQRYTTNTADALDQHDRHPQRPRRKLR